MKKQTRWNGESLKPGDVIDVDGTTGNRWIAHKIAETVRESGTAASDRDEDSQGPLVEFHFESMKINDLRKLAKERDLPYSNKMKKVELIELLRRKKGNAGEAPHEEKKSS